MDAFLEVLIEGTRVDPSDPSKGSSFTTGGDFGFELEVAPPYLTASYPVLLAILGMRPVFLLLLQGQLSQ